MLRALPIATLALTLIASAGCTSGAKYDPLAAEVQGDFFFGGVDPKLTRLLGDRVPGVPRSCLSTSERRDSQTFHGSIVFGRGTTVYRNDLNGCPELNSNSIPVFKSPMSSLCAGEIVELLDRTSRFPVGACSVGPFVPYMRTGR